MILEITAPAESGRNRSQEETIRHYHGRDYEAQLLAGQSSGHSWHSGGSKHSCRKLDGDGPWTYPIYSQSDIELRLKPLEILLHFKII